MKNKNMIFIVYGLMSSAGSVSAQEITKTDLYHDEQQVGPSISQETEDLRFPQPIVLEKSFEDTQQAGQVVVLARSVLGKMYEHDDNQPYFEGEHLLIDSNAGPIEMVVVGILQNNSPCLERVRKQGSFADE